jgi:hypothetical protein
MEKTIKRQCRYCGKQFLVDAKHSYTEMCSALCRRKYYRETHCSLCKKKEKLVDYLPKIVKEIVPKSKQRNYSVVFCKPCLKKLLKELKLYL